LGLQAANALTLIAHRFLIKTWFMKKIFAFGFSLLCIGVNLFAQKDYKVVIDITSRDTLSQQMALRWVDEIVKAEPTAQVEIVMYGQGTALAVQGRSAVADAIAGVVSNKNVSLRICSVAMANQKIDKSQLLPGIQTVPDGIYEIISKQHQGWGYIKVAH
jgi:intracellular sulfur oxidation DsrE/DsrF family protein